MKTVAIINQKGGVGKSTTALALGAGLIRKRKRVLFVDLDAQGNLSYALGAGEAEGGDSLAVLTREIPAAEAIRHTPGGDLLCATPALSGADKLLAAIGKEFRLREAIASLEDRYDWVVVDTPPALGILTINALTACDCCIVPAQADIFSLQGILQLGATVQAVQQYCNPALRVSGILLTRYNGRVIIGREIAEKMRETAEALQTRVFHATIREGTAIKEAQAMRQDIFAYAPRSNVATDYQKFVDEFLKEEKKHG
ncbi:MAG: ParA family protein [Clostridia bacterium]|nr:ParA family protein [Clostridia bacterium]